MNSFTSHTSPLQQQLSGSQTPGMNNMMGDKFNNMPNNLDSMHPAQLQRMREMMASGGGGMGMSTMGGGMGGVGGMTPAMLQQQQALMNGRGNMMNNMNLGGMGDMAGINMGGGMGGGPSAGGGMGMGAGMGMGGLGGGMNMGASSPANGMDPSMLRNLAGNPAAMNGMGMGGGGSGMSQQELTQRAMLMRQMQMQQQQQQRAKDDWPTDMGIGGAGGMGMNGGMGNGMMSNSMMPPPQSTPRPPTVRPGTSMSQHSPIAMHSPSLGGGMMPPGSAMRPPSRTMSVGSTSGDLAMNGFVKPPPTPSQQQQLPFFSHGSPPPHTPQMGQPHQLSPQLKRKLTSEPTNSPRLGMGPPFMNGHPGSARQTQSPRPLTAGGLEPKIEQLAGQISRGMSRQPSMDKPDLKVDMQSLGASQAAPGADLTSSVLPSSAAKPARPQYHLPSLPANVNLNPTVTKVSVVPLEESTSRIPLLEPSEIEDIKGWQGQDKEYEGQLRRMKLRMAEEAKEAFGQPNWWERGSRDVDVNAHRRLKRREEFQIVYTHPEVKKSRKKHKREGFRLPRRIDPKDANRPERLVPVRLEVEVEHHKLRDTFVWNLNDPVITPERFAQSVAEDYGLPSSYVSTIAKQIQEQLSDYQTHTGLDDGAEADDEAPPIVGQQGDEDATWWEGWRNRLRLESGSLRGESSTLKGRKRRRLQRAAPDEAESDVEMDVPAERPKALEEFEVDEEGLREDMRITVKLDIIVGSMKLEDQFEWDVEDSTISPEDFAEVYAQDLGLAGEFKTAIAHCIREQVFAYKKSLYLVGHTSDASGVQDEELRQAFLPSLTSGARPADQVSAFTPTLYYASDGEIERSEKEREREMNKRRKRNTRGRRGVALPDRDPIRTYRTPAIGFPELDPAVLAAAAAANAPTSRRAAAAAASLTIANMVANENGSPPFTAAQLPGSSSSAQQSSHPPPKEKKVKGPGLFTAPPFDPSVLRPRAQITAPTRSTAVDDDGSGKPRLSKEKLVQREREREKDAKEKEYMARQHPTDVDGVWHCSNCGRPDDLAGGKRKGPMGDKTQCAACGKFWHRFRRPRPVTWNTDPGHHARAIVTEKAQEEAEALAKLQAADDRSPPPPSKRKKAAQPRNVPPPPESRRADSSSPVVQKTTKRAVSPNSSTSSISDAPLAQTIKTNGTANGTGEEESPTETRPGTPPPGEKSDGPASPTRPTPAPLQTSDRNPASSHSTQSLQPPPKGAQPPEWLLAALKALQRKYPTDRFEVVLRKVSTINSPEWRIKCLDCPGKLYTPGSGETLQNYEVHLKNRQHRQRVNDRLAGAPPG